MGGLALSATMASLALSGAPAALPGVAGVVYLGATALAAVGCLGMIVEELGRVREERLALQLADAEDVDALRDAMRRRSGGSTSELSPGDDSSDR